MAENYSFLALKTTPRSIYTWTYSYVLTYELNHQNEAFDTMDEYNSGHSSYNK